MVQGSGEGEGASASARAEDDRARTPGLASGTPAGGMPAAAAATERAATRTQPAPSHGVERQATAPEQAPDFAAVYARTGAAGDPKIDQVLVAFESLNAAMPAAQVAMAISATAHAIGADRAMISTTLAKRLMALDATIAESAVARTNAGPRDSPSSRRRPPRPTPRSRR